MIYLFLIPPPPDERKCMIKLWRRKNINFWWKEKIQNYFACMHKCYTINITYTLISHCIIYGIVHDSKIIILKNNWTSCMLKNGQSNCHWNMHNDPIIHSLLLSILIISFHFQHSQREIIKIINVIFTLNVLMFTYVPYFKYYNC